MNGPSNTHPASLQWVMAYPASDFSAVSAVAGGAATAAGKALSCNNVAGTSTCVLYGLNQTAISAGIVATVTLTISPSTLNTSSNVQLTSGMASSSAGSAISSTNIGATVTITPISTCSFSINPPNASLNGSAAAGSVNVVTSAGCSWAASSNAPWLTITSSASGSGPGSVSYSMPANPGPSSRIGTLTVAGQTFTVTQAAPVVVITNVSATPSSGSGSVQTFGFLFSDSNGFTDLSTIYMLINPVLNWPGSCFTSYVRSSNTLYLLNDAGTFWLGPVTPAGGGSLANSSCTLSAGGSSVLTSGNNLTVSVALTFAGAFAGTKSIYMNAQDAGGLWSNWQQRGAWTVPPVGNQPPSAVSVTPASGSGSNQTFSFLFSDANGFADLSTAYMLVNATLNWPGSCYAAYTRASNTLWLLNDSATFWLGPVTPGVPGTLQNSQCSLNGVGSSGSGSGNNLTVSVSLTFISAFGGAKNLYMNALNNGGLWSNWQQGGAWTVPAVGNQPPSAVSVTPASGSGSNQIFSFLFSDPSGFADLSTTYMLIDATLNWSGSCYTSYVRSSNALFLLSDSGTFWLGPVTPGGTGSLANSQCTLSAGASSVSGSGNNLSVNLALTFASAFSGGKNVFMNAEDAVGLWSNWQQRGAWTLP